MRRAAASSAALDADSNLRRERIGGAARRPMEIEVGAKTVADRGRTSADRRARRIHRPAWRSLAIAER
ncbi:MAG: hypothetical protein AAF676_18250, partial [Pseudomonadota bacterium]